MTHDEYLAAAVDDEGYHRDHVEAKQSGGKIKLPSIPRIKDGAYFIYNMPC